MTNTAIRTLSVGKLRGLQQCATSHSAFAVLALDHRNNLRHALRPDAPDTVTTGDMVTFKHDLVSVLAPTSSAVLLDPEFGAAQCIASGALTGSTGLVVALEATGYTGNPTARQSQILPGWSVEKARRIGASAIKLLVYYHPDSPTAGEIEALVKQVADECIAQDIAFFLEPLSYSFDPSRKKLSAEERYRVVLETAQRLTIPGVDVLKAEFPLDMTTNPDTHEMAKACANLSASSPIPWVLLSASVSYDTYMRQVTVACQEGASGVAAGRAVWQEASQYPVGDERMTFLRGTAYERMERLTELCSALARPWTDFFAAGPIAENWYASY